ncbi:MAG: UvrD-helicase domain-containing protein [Pseudomonadota bacterium]|nr:MAG: ATP-dependent DNA helicase [Pseudomonadota bacterium]
MPELNEPQCQAVAHTRGPLIVFAGAGSGKTRTITYRIANLLATERVPPYRILAVTFTNKAAGEMRERLERLAGAEVTRDLWIGTFHSICARLLRRYHAAVGLGKNYVIYDDADQKALVGRVLKDMGLGDQAYPPKLVLSLISREKREGYLPADTRRAGRLDGTHADIYERYQDALVRSDAADFDDLLLYGMRIAESDTMEGEELRNRFSHVLVDEFQDTNLIQYRLIRALAERTRNLCVVGDDDQSIYRWRGADVRLIRNFKHDFPDATLIKLEQNYRSTGNIVAAALGVIRNAREREPKELWTDAPPGERVRIRAFLDEREESTFVATSIQREIARGTSGRQIAVFYRVHAQSRALEEALRAVNVPYRIIGGMKFFERAEVKDLLAYLRLILNPKSDTDLLRIINVPARGIGDKTVDRLLARAAEDTTSAFEAIDPLIASDELGGAAKKKLAAFRDMIAKLRERADALRPSELARRVLEASGYEAALREDDSAEADARLGNLEELVGAIAEYEEEAEEQGETPTLAGYLERVSLVANTDVEAQGSEVSLMTVHAAKGLEFDTVFLTGMEETIFPYRGVDKLRGDSEEDLDEERRLAYVAITRARRRLVISHVSMRQLFGRTHWLEPSRFLDDIPEEVAERDAPPRSERPRFGGDPYRFRAFERPWQSRPSLAPGTRIVERDEPVPVSDDWDGPEVVLRPGATVHHATFGRGVVESVESGSSPTVVARFASVGRKRVKAQFLELSPHSTSGEP